MIEVQNLSKHYGPFTAVDNISFNVERGEIVGFLGPNGAGKTTTIRMLTCYMPVSEGSIKISGYDVFEDSIEVRKRIGYLPETPPLYLDMTVQEYLHFVAKIKGIPAKERKAKVEKAMERTALVDRRKWITGRLSKGFRQRVGLAQALVHEPDVLILDEPTSGLDPQQIIEMRNLIQELAKEHTFLLSTHTLSEVAQSCNRVVMIERGKIRKDDTIANLTKDKSLEEVFLDVMRESEQEIAAAARQAMSQQNEPEAESESAEEQ